MSDALADHVTNARAALDTIAERVELAGRLDRATALAQLGRIAGQLKEIARDIKPRDDGAHGVASADACGSK